MTRFEIVPAKAQHCGQMARRLRAEHRAFILSLGLNAHLEMRGAFDASAFRRAWLIDGELAGLGGVIGTTLSATGFVWLALSERALAYPVQIIREARRQLDEIMVTRREVATTVICGDEAARRFAVFLGFHVLHPADPTEPGAPAKTAVMRRRLQLLLDDPAFHLPVGNRGYVVPMGYHQESPEALCA